MIDAPVKFCNVVDGSIKHVLNISSASVMLAPVNVDGMAFNDVH